MARDDEAYEGISHPPVARTERPARDDTEYLTSAQLEARHQLAFLIRRDGRRRFDDGDSDGTLGICSRCHAMGRRLDLHHLFYVRLGREAEFDLMVLCAECHAAEHGIILPGGC